MGEAKNTVIIQKERASTGEGQEMRSLFLEVGGTWKTHGREAWVESCILRGKLRKDATNAQYLAKKVLLNNLHRTRLRERGMESLCARGSETQGRNRLISTANPTQAFSKQTF